MTQHIVLAVVIIVSIWAHVWIFKFMRFKIDEGVVLRYLIDHVDSGGAIEIQDLSDKVDLSVARIEKAACKSGELSFENGCVRKV